MLCPSCGERNPDRARFCLNCGAALGPQARRDEERAAGKHEAAVRFWLAYGSETS